MTAQDINEMFIKHEIKDEQIPAFMCVCVWILPCNIIEVCACVW